MTDRDERIADALLMLKDIPDAECLLAILAQASGKPAGTEGPLDLSALVGEAEAAAAFLVSAYGHGALERALLLEKRLNDFFSRIVRRKLEESLAAGSTSAE